MYNVGDRVKINPESQYVGQAGRSGKGTVMQYYGDVRYCYSVLWNCGVRNDYKVSDLLPNTVSTYNGSVLKFNFIKNV